MFRRLFDFLLNKLVSRLGLALLALALLVNLSALLMVDREIAILEKSRERTVHSRNVTTQILAIQAMLYESESAQRGFLYTSSEDYLEPLNRNDSQIGSRLAKLHEMVADNPPQQILADEVRKIALEKMIDINKTIAAHKMGQKDIARSIVMSDQGVRLMDELGLKVARFLTQEELVLKARLMRSAEIQLAIRWGFAIILFINALMILAGAVAIMRGMAREINRDMADVVRHDEREAVSASEVVQRAAELRALTAHLLLVQEEERKTVARELHDELGGTLSAVKMDILMGRDAAAKRNDEKSVARLQRALSSIDSAIHFIRRLIEDLRPTLLDNIGLEAALRAMVDQFSERCGVKCEISLPAGELNLSSAQSTAVYRICQEALTNVMKYAKARQVTINLTSEGSVWTLQLADDGVGLATTQQQRSVSHGLLGMRERMVALGGSFDIRGAAGQGTTLTAAFPIIERPQPVLE